MSEQDVGTQLLTPAPMHTLTGRALTTPADEVTAVVLWTVSLQTVL